MSLTKIPVPINFAGGYGQKTDPKQLAIGRFQKLENTTFNKVGLLQKRNGFAELTSLNAVNLTSVTTYSQSLVALGSTLNVFSEDQNEWLNRGNINQVSLSTIPVVRSSTNQSSVDASLSVSGLSLETWIDSDGTCKYQVNDSSNGQVILSAVNLPTGAMVPRAFALSTYFIVTYLITVSGTPKLEYISIPVNNLTNPNSPVVISSVVKSNTTGYDGTVVLDILYLAWNGSDGGGAIHQVFMNRFLTLSSVRSITGHNGTLISIMTDSIGINTWITYWDSGSGNAYTSILNQRGVVVLAPTKTISTTVITHLTSQLLNNVLNIVYEVSNTYPSGVISDYSSYNTITQSGTVGSPSVILRSVGLASKAFIQNDTIYCMFVYGGAFQPTYFVSDLLGNIQVKLAYSNGGGYIATQILPNVTFTSSGYPYITYQYKDLLVSVNKTLNTSNNNTNIYTQAGINTVTLNFNASAYSVEIGNNLNLSGGVFTSYDGNKPVEQEFNVWPEDITFLASNTGGAMSAQDYFYKVTYEWTDSQGNLFRSAPSIPQDVTTIAGSAVTFTASFDININYLTISSSSGLIVGQVITDNTTSGNIQPGTYITSITAGGSATTTSVFASGVNNITVASSAGFSIGQTITDSTTGGNITTGTIITAISGNVLGLSLPTAGASASSPGDTLAVSAAPVIGVSLPTLGSTGSDTLQTTNFSSVTMVIPTLRLTAKPKVRIVIYRWSTDNQSYYQITSISNPLLSDPTVDTVTYVDTTNDNLIIGNELLYTTGGVVENIAPPSTQIMTLYKSRLVLLDAEDTNLLWYSKQVIENTPVEMSDFFTIYVAPTIGANKSTGPVTALGAMDDKLIVFKRDAMYYILGNGPDNTGANDDFSDPIFIAGTVGSTNQQSIGLIPPGLMFQSDKGIWILNRNLSTDYIGKDVEDFTVNATVMSTVLIPGTNQIRFTLSSGVTLMYDYFVQQWGSFVNIPGISSVVYNNLHTYLRSDGAVFQETPGVYLDGSTPTTISFTTSWFNIAGLQGYQRAYQYYLLGTYLSPHVLQVQTAYDYQSYPTQSEIIQPDNYSTPWGGDPTWGESETWGGVSNTEQWRVNLSQQKCQSVQITVNEVFDPSFGANLAGAGLTLSGINLIMGAKSGYPRLAPGNISGGA